MRSAVIVDLNAMVITPERHEKQTEHVKRGDESREEPNQPVDPVGLIRFPENLVLAPKARERPNSRDRQRCDEHGCKCDWDVRLQSAHLAHVLLTTDRVYH